MPIYLPRLPARVQRAQEWEPTTVLEAALAVVEDMQGWSGVRALMDTMEPGPVRACLDALHRLCWSATFLGVEDLPRLERARLRADLLRAARQVREWARTKCPEW